MTETVREALSSSRNRMSRNPDRFTPKTEKISYIGTKMWETSWSSEWLAYSL